MKVILREDVSHLGKPGTIVDVKPGYARNFLIPQGIAAPASDRNVKLIEHQMRVIQKEIDAAKAAAEEVLARLAKLSVTISKPAGDNERLFGSVTTRDIASALAAEGVKIDRRNITIEEAIKSLGVYTVKVRLHGGVTGDLKVWVVKE